MKCLRYYVLSCLDGSSWAVRRVSLIRRNPLANIESKVSRVDGYASRQNRQKGRRQCKLPRKSRHAKNRADMENQCWTKPRNKPCHSPSKELLSPKKWPNADPVTSHVPHLLDVSCRCWNYFSINDSKCAVQWHHLQWCQCIVSGVYTPLKFWRDKEFG